MKKTLLILVLCACSFNCVPQVVIDSGIQTTHQVKIIDHTKQIQQAIDIGIELCSATHTTIVPGVDNTLTGSILAFIVGGIFRFFERRNLKKNGRLLPKE